MKQIEKLIKLIEINLQKKKKIFFFFDYDGVLAPIQNNPDKAYLSRTTKDSLIKLLKNKLFKVALVSGRTLNTLQRLTKLNNKEVIFIGSHGFELLYKGKISFFSKQNISTINKIRPKALKVAKSVAKGFLEHKPYTFTYHIRDTKKADLVERLSRAMKKFLKENKLHNKLKILKGKNIIEVLPQEVSKGNAVEKIIKQFPNYSYIYFGDDVTDISALRAVKKYKGISVSFNSQLRYKTDFLINQKDIDKIICTRKLKGLLIVK